MLTKEQILNAKDLTPQKVKVPEWDGFVYVRGLTGKERDNLELSVTEIRGNKQTVNLQNLRAKLCSLCIVDESGKSLFTSEDINALTEKSGIALNRIFMVAQKLSGLTPEDVDKLTTDFLADPKENSISD
jgi:hypothetical protein